MKTCVLIKCLSTSYGQVLSLGSISEAVSHL